ncbi:hypothetical protein F0U60_14615 [Archangium minus]|uniref:Lipoprotein n=1 Tax=Archangium minus TaxID=83450 RepID=A0ABY9WU26_9BACT|nr:hypothetical protein F0U60_14615 [Archangium minus]
MIVNSLPKFLVAGAFAAVSTFALDAHAQNPHFIGEPTARCRGANLEVSFKVAGLGQGEFVTVAATGDATAQCVNRGDNIPPGQTETVSASGTFGPASKSGNVVGALLLSPQAQCPGGQTLRVTYTDITLVLPGTGETVPLEGTFVCSAR